MQNVWFSRRTYHTSCHKPVALWTFHPMVYDVDPWWPKQSLRFAAFEHVLWSKVSKYQSREILPCNACAELIPKLQESDLLDTSLVPNNDRDSLWILPVVWTCSPTDYVETHLCSCILVSMLRSHHLFHHFRMKSHPVFLPLVYFHLMQAAWIKALYFEENFDSCRSLSPDCFPGYWLYQHSFQIHPHELYHSSSYPFFLARQFTSTQSTWERPSNTLNSPSDERNDAVFFFCFFRDFWRSIFRRLSYCTSNPNTILQISPMRPLRRIPFELVFQAADMFKQETVQVHI